MNAKQLNELPLFAAHFVKHMAEAERLVGVETRPMREYHHAHAAWAAYEIRRVLAAFEREQAALVGVRPAALLVEGGDA